jgi:hypothetical protein
MGIHLKYKGYITVGLTTVSVPLRQKLKFIESPDIHCLDACEGEAKRPACSTAGLIV